MKLLRDVWSKPEDWKAMRIEGIGRGEADVGIAETIPTPPTPPPVRITAPLVARVNDLQQSIFDNGNIMRNTSLSDAERISAKSKHDAAWEELQAIVTPGEGGDQALNPNILFQKTTLTCD